jgi:hypothetical protein
MITTRGDDVVLNVHHLFGFLTLNEVRQKLGLPPISDTQYLIK